MVYVTLQAKLEKLKNLDLYGCPVTNQPGYRDQVFGLLSNLQLLDGLDKEGKEGQESSDEEEEEDYEGNIVKVNMYVSRGWVVVTYKDLSLSV